jgi:hypothetical protein
LLASGAASELAPINVTVELALKNGQDDYLLMVDTPVAVAFGGVTDANVITIFSDRKIRVRLTSADGSIQSIPVDGTLLLVSKTVPFTAIDLTRVLAQETRVKVFIGQKT